MTNMTNMTSMVEILELTTAVANQGDRWLFIASLMLFGVFGASVMRYFVRQHERLIDDHRQARETYQESLRNMVAEQSAANQKLIVCLDNNTQALVECREELMRARLERERR